MATAIGLDTKFGIKKETSAGTPVAVGAGNQRVVLSADFDAHDKVVYDEETLSEFIADIWLERVQKGMTLKSFLRYWTQELEFAILSGGISALSPVSQGAIPSLAYAINYVFTTPPANAVTGVFDLIVKILELAGCFLDEFELTCEDGKAAEISWKWKAMGANFDSAVNTAVQVGNLTLPDAAFKSKLVHFDNLTVWLAHRDDATFNSSDAVCLKGIKITINPGLSDDNESTCGEQVPDRVKKLKATVVFNFLKWDSATLFDAVNTNQPLKAKVMFVSDSGVPGLSKSGLNPALLTLTPVLKFNINVDGDGIKSVTLTNALASGAAVAADAQTKIQALTPTNLKYALSYSAFTVTYNGAPPNDYYLFRSGSRLGADSSVVITNEAVPANNIADELKIGVANGGTEQVGIDDKLYFMFPELWPDKPPISVGTDRIPFELTAMAGAIYGASTPVGFTAAAEPLLDGNMATEPLRIITVNRQSTSPLA